MKATGRLELMIRLCGDVSISIATLTHSRAFYRATKSQSQIHLSRRQLATGRIESARQIAGRVNKAKEGEKAEMDRVRKRKSRFRKEEEEEG